MSMPTDISWLASFWAEDLGGATRPAEGAASPATIPNGGTAGPSSWSRNNSVLWTRSFGPNARDAAAFGNGNYYGLNVGADYPERTVVLVARVGATDDVDIFDSTSGRTVIDAAGGNFRLYAGSVVDGGPADTSPHLFIVHADSGAGMATIEIDGVPVGSGSISMPMGAALSLGDSGLGSGNVPGSWVAFAGVVDRVLTSGEKSALLAWAGTFYLGAEVPTPEGATAVDHDWGVVVTGELVPNQGTASTDHDWAIAVSGEAVPNEGAAAVEHDWSLTVVGETPVLTVPEGATAPSYSWDVLVYVPMQAQSLLTPSDAELAQARALQKLIMTDQGEIRGPSTRVFNESTRKYDVVPGDLVYEGRMLVQVRDIKASNVLVAEDREPSSDYAVKVPWNVAGASEGQVVWVTSSRDPDLINFYFTIKSVERSSWATCRRMIATLSGERS